MAMLVSDLVDEVGEAFRSYVQVQEASTALTSDMTDTDSVFTVADASRLGQGLVQIGDEMVWVRTVDRQTSTAHIEPWGRGQSGTTAASHSTGERVTVSPRYPRYRVLDAVKGAVQEIFPRIFAVANTLLTFNAAQINYPLPEDCYHVYLVEWQPTGPSLSWIPVRRWRQNKTPTTVELEILSRVQVGANRIRVSYIKNPPAALQMSDDLESMGYPPAARDVIVLGATARLAAFSETSRVQAHSVESSARAQDVPAGAGVSLSRFLYQLFRQRLEDESLNAHFRFPIVSHFTR